MTEEADREAPQAWIDALARSRADVAAGRTVSWEVVRAKLRATIEQMEAEDRARRTG